MKPLNDYLAAHGVPTEEAIQGSHGAESIDDGMRSVIATDSERILAAMAEQASGELGWAWEVTEFLMIARRGDFIVAAGRGLRCATSAYLATNPGELTSTTILALLHGRNLMMQGGTDG